MEKIRIKGSNKLYEIRSIHHTVGPVRKGQKALQRRSHIYL